MRKLSVILYGTAHRDLGEQVFMVFKTVEEAHEFQRDLPGNYDIWTVKGINWGAFEMVEEITSRQGSVPVGCVR